MLDFKNGWNIQIHKYANKYGNYQVYLSCFDSHSIISAIWNAKGYFSDKWVKNLFTIATDIHDKKNVVTIEQGTHQPEATPSGYGYGFCLHFTGRDPDGYAFHFYITQKLNSQPFIFRITYMENGIMQVSNWHL